MTTSPGPLRRECFHEIELYASDRRPCEIDVCDNTNLWGTPPASIRVLASAPNTAFARYPDLYSSPLKSAIARYIGVGEDWVVTGCGSDDVLDSTLRAFAEPGDRVAVPDPTFVAVPLFAQINGLEPVKIPLTPTGDVDVEHTLAARARVIYLCTPNNPTGIPFSRTAITEIVDNTTSIVIIDEAYAEFAPETFVDLARDRPNVLVTRTMSKAFGLAGLRVGYGIGRPELVAEVEKARGPYKVNAMAERAAVAALDDDREWVKARIADMLVNRARFVAALESLGLGALPSSANFVLVPVANVGAVSAAMRDRNVAARAFTALSTTIPALAATGGHALRITIGPWDVMTRVLEALGEAMQACA